MSDGKTLIEVRGLVVATHHGVTEAEQEAGQELVLDVWIDPGTAPAVLTDDVQDTVDYDRATRLVAELAAAERNRTLERVAQRIARGLCDQLGCGGVRVRAAKPEPPIDAELDEVAVTVTEGTLGGPG